VIDRMEARLSREAPPATTATLWASTFILMGLRYLSELADALFQRVRAMKESTTYQFIINEGKVEGTKAVLLLQGEDRFGPPSPETRAQVEAIKDFNRLKQLSKRLLHVASWEELLKPSRPASRAGTRKRTS
jgi:hypothetical protein